MPGISTTKDVSAIAAYEAAPSVLLGFLPDEIFFSLEAAASQVAYSFDGVNDAGALRTVAGEVTGCETLRVRAGQQKIWLRKLSGAAAPMTVRVSASTFRG